MYIITVFKITVILISTSHSQRSRR